MPVSFSIVKGKKMPVNPNGQIGFDSNVADIKKQYPLLRLSSLKICTLGREADRLQKQLKKVKSGEARENCRLQIAINWQKIAAAKAAFISRKEDVLRSRAAHISYLEEGYMLSAQQKRNFPNISAIDELATEANAYILRISQK